MKVSNKVPNSIQTSDMAKSHKADANKELSELGSKDKKASIHKGVGDSARIDFSNRAKDIQKAKELATPSDSIDEAKVARLQKLIDSGQYRINAEAIADRLVDEQMKMLP